MVPVSSHPRSTPFVKSSVLTAEQVDSLLAAAKDHRDYPLYVLIVITGMREGEVLGLWWSDVDLDNARLQVRRSLARVAQGRPIYQEPKTRRSQRTIELTRAAEDALRKHCTRQHEERRAARVWDDRGLVFPDKVGGEQYSSNFYRDRWMRRSPVPLRRGSNRSSLPKTQQRPDMPSGRFLTAVEAGLCGSVLEAPAGIEPAIKVLQTSALPLGHGAIADGKVGAQGEI